MPDISATHNPGARQRDGAEGTHLSIGAMLRRDVHPSKLLAHAQAHADQFDELWVVEDLPFAGGIAQAAAVLAQNPAVTIGHGIAPAPFRNPVALAMEWATLAEAFPGRFRAGLGHGVHHWMASIGTRSASPLSRLRETTEALVSLLDGETVSCDGDYVKLDNIRLQFPPSIVPPLFLGVSGPKSLQLSGELAAGTILGEGHGPAEIEAARGHIAIGAERAGRDPSDHQVTVYVGCLVGTQEEMAPRNPDAAVGWEAINADPEGVAASLTELIEIGITSIVVVPMGLDVDQQLDRIATEVLPLL